MQASAFFLLACCLQVGAATYSQQTVSFSGKDVPLKTIFASVKKETGFGFFYENGEEATLKGASAVTLDLKNVSLEMFLRICLKNQPLEYSVEGTTIFIKKKETQSTSQVDGEVGEPITEIKGRVTNDKGEPLVNANVVVKRTGRGTVTDANGQFMLRGINSTDEILVSFIGYKLLVVSLQNRKSLSLIMEVTKDDLDKVVIQAYGTTSNRLATGNIGKITADDISRQPVANVLEALQGQVAGAIVTNTTGYASGNIKVEIRGRNTINPNFPTDPLYVIDGVPLDILSVPSSGSSSYNNGNQSLDPFLLAPTSGNVSVGQSPLFNINPSDIESMEVLKDADATAIYGSRGSNGVILITTKKGQAGKTKLELTVNEGVDKVTQHYKMLNSQQYVAMRREALKNDQLPIDIDNAPDLTVWDTTRYTDWQKSLWGRVGQTTDFQTALSGGTPSTSFRVSAGYYRNADILIKSGANNRGSASLNLNHKTLNQKVTISLNTNFSITNINEISTPSNVTIAPNAPAVYNQKGALNYLGWVPLDEAYQFGSYLTPYIAQMNLFNNNIAFNYEIFAGLTMKLNLGYNNFQNHQTNKMPIAAQDPNISPTGSTYVNQIFGHTLIEEPQLEYNTFIKKGKLSILAGASNQNSSTETLFLIGQGFKNDLLLPNIGSAPVQQTINTYGQYKYAALFGRINYNYKNKYIINLNARRDGSSRFGPGRQFGNFGSVAGAWIFNEEEWVKRTIPILSFGKLRGSYGTTGGDQIGDYSYLSTWSFSNVSYNNVTALFPRGLTDSVLHWQVNKKMELGLSVGFIKDRLTLDISWYRDRCNNQLIAFPTPIFDGFTSVTSNSLANVQNMGWEYVLNTKIVDNRDFQWSVKINLGVNRNKLLSYPNLSQSPYSGSFQIGEPLNSVKLLTYEGVNPQTGLYSFKTKNSNGIPTFNYNGQPDDRHWVDLSPKYDGGVSSRLSLKNWELSFLFYFRKQIGKNYLNYTAYNPAGTINANQPIQVLNRWQKPGDIATVAKFTTSPDISYTYFGTQSDAAYTDASFARLQNLMFSYSFPEKIMKRAKIVNLRIYLKGENLFVITKYNGLDPELQSFGSFPIPRTLTAGITCNF